MPFKHCSLCSPVSNNCSNNWLDKTQWFICDLQRSTCTCTCIIWCVFNRLSITLILDTAFILHLNTKIASSTCVLRSCIQTFINNCWISCLGDTCLSPKVKSEVYTTTDASISTDTVVVAEFTLTCKNGLSVSTFY